jgi:hypothetical protein
VRRIHRTDSSQTAIVKALRKAGVLVKVIGRPVDLACRLPSYPPGMFKLLECKTVEKGDYKPSKKQQEQAEFCASTGTPYVTTAEQALREIGL